MGTQGRASLWTVLLLLVVLDVGGIIVASTWVWIPTGDSARPYRSFHLEPDGRLFICDHDLDGRAVLVRQFWPSSALTELPIGWAVAIGAGLVLVMLVVSRTLARRRFMSTRPARPRFTMSRGMVLIGAVSIWLWLSRTEMFWILCGSLVLLLALLADSRRICLAQEIKTKGTSTTVGMRLGIAGYWVAVILALAWVISVLVWDSLRLVR